MLCYLKMIRRYRSVFYFMMLIIVFAITACNTSQTNNKKQNDTSDLISLSKPITDSNIYSKNVDVGKLEAFDINKQGDIFYARLGELNNQVKGKNEAHKVFIYKARPNQKPHECMILEYFGHPYNISVEEDMGETFIWISSNGSKHKTGKYWDERSVSRIKYKSGMIYGQGYGGETFFLNNGKLKTQVAINKESDLLCIAAQNDKDWSFYTYNLSKVKTLPDTTFTFKVTIGGEEVGSEEQTIKKIVKGHDLGKLTPLGFFTIPGDRNNKPNGLNSFWLQGFTIDRDSLIYFYEGEGNRQGRLAQAHLTVLDIYGNQWSKRTKVEAISDSSKLNDIGVINNAGNMEPEGMTIKGSFIYLGFLSHGVGVEEKDRRANIFKFKISSR